MPSFFVAGLSGVVTGLTGVGRNRAMERFV